MRTKLTSWSRGILFQIHYYLLNQSRSPVVSVLRYPCYCFFFKTSVPWPNLPSSVLPETVTRRQDMGNDGFRHFTNLRVYIYITAITYSIYRAISCYYTYNITCTSYYIFTYLSNITHRLKTRSVLHPFCDPCKLRAAPMGKSQGLSSRRQAKNSPEKCWNSMHHLGCMKPYEIHWNPVNNIK